MAIASDGAYDLQPGFQYPGNPYYTDAGKDYYNVNDPDKAKALLRQAGYRGEELVLITTSSYSSIYNGSLVVAQQLSDIGMKVRTEVFD